MPAYTPVSIIESPFLLSSSCVFFVLVLGFNFLTEMCECYTIYILHYFITFIFPKLTIYLVGSVYIPYNSRFSKTLNSRGKCKFFCSNTQLFRIFTINVSTSCVEPSIFWATQHAMIPFIIQSQTKLLLLPSQHQGLLTTPTSCPLCCRLGLVGRHSRPTWHITWSSHDLCVCVCWEAVSAEHT